MALRGPMRIAGQVFVSVAGELDFQTAAVVRAAVDELARTNGQRVVLDLAGLSFIDSSGLGLFVEESRKLRGGGGDLLLSHPSRQVLGRLHQTGLDRVLTIIDNN
jgi:anti-sigma B factor antagonist